jgi:hypothetical protein
MYRLLDVMVRHTMASFQYRRGIDPVIAARSCALPDYRVAEMAGYDHRDGKWKRCSDLRGKPDDPDPEKRGRMWTAWLCDEHGEQEQVRNPHTNRPVGSSFVTELGFEAWMRWRGEG